MTLLIGRTIGKVLFYFKEVQNEKYSVGAGKHNFNQMEKARVREEG